MFADGAPVVQSANIVGYQNVEQEQAGYFVRTATFKSIGTTTDSFSIQSIIPVEPEGTVVPLEDGVAQIQILDAGGEVDPTIIYFWYLEGSESVPGGKAGWYVDDGMGGWKLADKTFVRGEAFIYAEPFYSADPEVDDPIQIPGNIQIAGEVDMSAKLVQCNEAGYFLIANYKPVAIDIQKLSPIAPAESVVELEDGVAQIQILDSEGAVDPFEIYYWYLEGSESVPGGKAGWYVDDGVGGWKLAEKTFAPGEGFIYAEPFYSDDPEQEEPPQLPGWLQFAD